MLGQLSKILSVEVLHDDERQPGAGVTGIHDVDESGVANCLRDVSFGEQPISHVLVIDIERIEDLDGHALAGSDSLTEVHARGTAAAQRTEDPIIPQPRGSKRLVRGADRDVWMESGHDRSVLQAGCHRLASWFREVRAHAVGAIGELDGATTLNRQTQRPSSVSMHFEPSTRTLRSVAALDSLPTLPIVAVKIGEVIHSKDVSVQQIAEILRTDPATSAKLLRLVNSPYFGIPGGVTDVARAIPFVGFNTLYQLVLSITVVDTLGAQGSPADLRSVWVHSLTVAAAAREVAIEMKFPDTGSCFTAGLLHDIGKIALPKISPEKLARAQAAVAAEGISMREAEQRYGIVPTEILGSRLAKQWRFPLTLATAIEHHQTIHRPETRSRLAAHLRPVTEIVAVAHQLATSCESTFGVRSGTDEGEQDHLEELCELTGLSTDQLVAICDRTRSQLERSKIFLSLLGG